jgi:hypothetical protein
VHAWARLAGVRRRGAVPIQFRLALFDCEILQKLQLKCTKVKIAKLYIKGSSTTFTKAIFAQWFEHELQAKLLFFHGAGE